jgi:hypothetical protein
VNSKFKIQNSKLIQRKRFIDFEWVVYLRRVVLVVFLANGIRAPVATTGGTPATHWLGYTNKTHLRGFQIL